MIKAIIFDLNHVIVSYRESRLDNEYRDMLGVGRDEFWVIARKYHPEHNVGKIGIDEYFSRVLADLGLSERLLPVAKHLFKKEILPVKGMEEVLRELKGRFRVILLAGDGRDFLAAKLEKFSLEKLFDAIYATCFEGIEKTEPEIYRRVLNKEGLVPGECVFVDDTESYLRAAEKAGIKNTIRFTDSLMLRRELKRLGIAISQ